MRFRSGANLGLGLAPSRLTGPIRWLCVSRGTGRGQGAGEQEHGPKHFGAWGLRSSLGLGGPCPLSRPERPAARLVARFAAGRQSESWRGLGGHQSLALRHQAPSKGPLIGHPRCSVSPQEAGRPDVPAVQRPEGWAEVRALGSGRVGPSVLAQAAFEGRRGLGGPCPFSHPERPAARLVARVAAGQQGRVWRWGFGVPNPRRCGDRRLGMGPSVANLGLEFAPRRPEVPIHPLCKEQRGGPR